MTLKNAVALLCALLTYIVSSAQSITPAGPAGFCPGDKVTLTATGGLSYQWKKNGTNVPGANQVKLEVNSSGDYSVTITRANPLPDTTLGPVKVTEHANPVADFTTDKNNVCSGTDVKFTSTVTGGKSPYLYSWAFADGGVSTAQNPLYANVALGCGSKAFNNKLIVTDANGCSAEKVKETTIIQAPRLEFEDPTGFQFSNCSNKPNASNPIYIITVNNNSPDKNCTDTYSIDWGDGTSANNLTDANFPLDHKYQNLGAYNLVVTGNGKNSCKATKTYLVRNQSIPDAGLGKFDSPPSCDSVTAHITINNWERNSPGTIYVLNYGNGSSKTFTHPINTKSTPDTSDYVYKNSPCEFGLVSFPLSIVATNSCRSETFSGGTIEVNIRPKASFTVDLTTCAGKQLCFTNTTKKGFYTTNTGCSSETKWLWDFGDLASGVNNTSTLENPCHTFSNPGNYTVTLTSNNLCGPTKYTQQICVMDAPKAAFNLNAKTGCAPFTTSITNVSDTGFCKATSFEWSVTYDAKYCGTSSSWSFAPGSNAASTNPSFIFKNPGDYTIKLTIKSPCTNAIFSDVVSIKDKPVIKLPADTSTCGVFAYLPRTVIPACETGPLTYDWKFADASMPTSNMPNPLVVTFNTLGTHLISLTAANGCGETNLTQNVTINTLPVVTIPNDTAFCTSENTGPLNFTSSNNATVTWTNDKPTIGLAASGSGNINSFTPSNSGNSPIVATIRVTAKIGNCTKDYSFTITVNPKPQPPVVTANINYCTGDVATALSASGSGIILWYTTANGGTGTQTAPVPQTTTQGVTIYYASSKSGNTGCESSRSPITVTIKPIPGISSATPTNPLTCGASNGTITLKGLLPNTAYTVNYKKGSTPTTRSLSTNASGDLIITGLEAAQYAEINVVLNGCPSNMVGPFQLSDPTTPPAPVAGPNVSICSGNSINLSATSLETGTITYTWRGNNYNASGANQTIPNATVAATGNYYISITSNGCKSLEDTVSVLVNATPAKPAISGILSVCSGQEIQLTTPDNPTLTYLWKRPNGTTSTAASLTIPNAQSTDNGQYELIATAIAGNCPSPASTASVTVKPTPVISGTSLVHPDKCGAATGSILLNGLTAGSNYTVSYTISSVVETKLLIAASNGTVTIPNLATGTYADIKVNLNGCPSTPVGPFTLDDPTTPPAPVAGPNVSICSGNSINLSATSLETGTITYTWRGNNYNASGANQTIPNATVAATGNYYISITSNGCKSLEDTVSVLVNATPAKPAISGILSVCSGQEIQLTTPDNPTLTYLWKRPNGTTSTAAILTIPNAQSADNGQYELIATAIAGNCPSPVSTVSVTVKPTPVISGTSLVHPDKCGAATGSILLNGLTAGSNYTVSYTTGNVVETRLLIAATNGTLTIPGLAAGSYLNIRVELNGCPSNIIAQEKLEDPNPPAAPVATEVAAICSGNTLSLSATSSVPGTVTYTWRGPNSFSTSVPDPTILNTTTNASGKYYVSIKVNNCNSLEDSVTVLVNPTPLRPDITTNSPVCSGTAIQLNTPANPLFTYLWIHSNGFSSTIANPVILNAAAADAGVYSLVVTSIAGNCPSPIASTNVIIKPTPNISTTSSINPSNCGTPTGSITLNGLIAGTTYTISYIDATNLPVSTSLVANSSGAVIIPALYKGTYTNITATLNDCPSNTIATIKLTDPNPPAAPLADGRSPLCTGDTIRLSASTNVTQQVSYRWTGPANFTAATKDPVISPAEVAQSGWYQVTITLNNCESLPDSVEIVVNPRPDKPTITTNSPVCREDSLQLGATSAPAGLVSFAWSGPNGFSSTDQNPVIRNVAVANGGNYIVTAIQANCTSVLNDTATVIIKPKPDIGIVTINNPTSCGTFTGSIVLEGFSPNTVYNLTYNWNSAAPANVPATSNPAGAVVIRDLPAGTYTNIRVGDNGCSSNPVGPLQLVNVPATTPTISSNGPLCAGNTLELTAALAVAGAVKYEWLGPNGFTSNAQKPIISTVPVEASGTYTVTTTLNGCSSSNSVNVLVSPASKGGFSAADSTVCLGTNTGLINVSGFTGAVVRWQSSTNNGVNWNTINNTASSLVYSNLTTTTLFRAVVESGVCPVAYSLPAKITVVNKVDDATAGPDQKLCNQAVANLVANNPVVGKGLWSQVAGPILTITRPDNATTTVTGLQPDQTYRFRWTITGATGCGSSNDEMEIINRPGITTASAGSDVYICNFTNAQTIALVGNSIRTFEKGAWRIISQPTPATATFSNNQIPDSKFTFSQPGLYRLVWSVSNDVATGCNASIDTMTITALNPPVAAFTLSTTTLCTGNPLTVANQSLNANTFQWYWGDGDTSFFASGSHIYTTAASYTIKLVAKSVIGTAVCADSTTQVISTVTKIPAQIQVAGGKTCIPYNLTVNAPNATGASSVRWIIYDHSLTPAVTFANGLTAAHTYNFAGSDSVKLVVNNTAGCADTATYRFKVYSVPVSTFEPASLTTCSHDTLISYTATTGNTNNDPVNYKWFVNGRLSGNANPFVYRLITPGTAATTYTVQLLAQNAGTCGDTTPAARIVVQPLPAAGIKVSPFLIQQQPEYTFTFEDSTTDDPAKRYLWELGDRSQQTRSERKITYKYGDTGVYKVRLYITNATTGCSNSDSATVQVEYIPGYLQVPNAICPGCSSNEVRQFLPLGKGLSYYRLRIYTTWGQKIFETIALNPDGSPKEAWSGKVDNLPTNKSVQQDVYRWEIEARYTNGTEWRGMVYPNSSKPVKSGFLTVIK